MAWTYLEQNGPALVILGLIISFGVVVTPWTYAVPKGSEYFTPRGWRRRGRKMRRDRKDFVTNIVLMDFTDRIETRVMNEEISRAEAQELYTRLKRVFPTVKDIYPSHNRLKEKINKRLGTHSPVPLPDRVVPKKKPSFFDPQPPKRVVL